MKTTLRVPASGQRATRGPRPSSCSSWARLVRPAQQGSPGEAIPGDCRSGPPRAAPAPPAARPSLASAAPTLLAAVHELAGVDAFGGDEQLCPLLKSVRIAEDHLGEGRAATWVVDDILQAEAA